MEIFLATCPSCERGFDCDVHLLAEHVERWRCPWCMTYFDRKAAKSVFTARSTAAAAESGPAGEYELLEFEGHR